MVNKLNDVMVALMPSIEGIGEWSVGDVNDEAIWLDNAYLIKDEEMVIHKIPFSVVLYFDGKMEIAILQDVCQLKDSKYGNYLVFTHRLFHGDGDAIKIIADYIEEFRHMLKSEIFGIINIEAVQALLKCY